MDGEVYNGVIGRKEFYASDPFHAGPTYVANYAQNRIDSVTMDSVPSRSHRAGKNDCKLGMQDRGFRGFSENQADSQGTRAQSCLL